MAGREPIPLRRVRALAPDRPPAEIETGTTPMIVTGLGSAPGNLLPRALADRFGEATVTVAKTRNGRLSTDRDVGLVTVRTTLSEFVEALEAGSPLGYLMTPLEELPEELRSQLQMPWRSGRHRFRRSKLWISARGTVSPLHRDVAPNLHTQIHGRKRFSLYAPGKSARLYPAALTSSTPNFSRVDPEAPDFDRFPRFREARAYVGELSPGDAIYIPRLWWHHVRTMEDSVTVNCWFANGAWTLPVVAADLLKRLRGLSR